MRWFEFKAIFAKDLLELARKPASLLIGILLPGILMPVFVLSITDLQAQLGERIVNIDHRIVLLGTSARLSNWFKKSEKIHLITPGVPAIAGANCDALLTIPDGFESALDENRTGGTLTLTYDSLKENSMLTLGALLDSLARFKDEMILDRLHRVGIISREQPSVRFIDLDEDLRKKHLSRYDAASFLLLLVFSIYAAASSAGAEVVTAERERNTLESLLLTPANRSTIVRAKLMLIFAVAVVCIILTMTTYSLKYQMAAGIHLSTTAMIGLELLCLPLILTLGLTVVSITMLLAAYSRSVQQSMGYAFYLGLMLIGAAGVSFNPVVSLSSPAVLIPVSGLAIAIVDMLSGRPDWFFIALAAAAGVLYCVLFTLPAAHLLQSDESLYNLQLSPAQRLRQGTWAQPLLFLFVGVFLSMFYAGQALLQWKAVIGLILTQLVAVLAPALAFLKIYKLPIKETLSFNRCRVTDIIGAVCMAPFTVAAAGWLFSVQSKLMPAPEELFKAMNELIMPTGTPWWQILVSAALMPAVCEEILFRGVFQGLLSMRMKPVQYVPVIGLLFGMFHFSLFRFMPTATLGMLLSLVVWRTGSIFPAMALHFAHNSIATMLGKNETFDFTLPVLLGVFVSLGVGIALLSIGRKEQSKLKN